MVQAAIRPVTCQSIASAASAAKLSRPASIFGRWSCCRTTYVVLLACGVGHTPPCVCFDQGLSQPRLLWLCERSNAA